MSKPHGTSTLVELLNKGLAWLALRNMALCVASAKNSKNDGGLK
jgi:hypothetical protein